jgi:hypothetical protein
MLVVLFFVICFVCPGCVEVVWWYRRTFGRSSWRRQGLRSRRMWSELGARWTLGRRRTVSWQTL